MEMKIKERLDPIDSNVQTQIPIIISRQLKKISTLTKSEALYSQVIEKNFEIINELLKKLQMVFSSTFISIIRELGVLIIVYKLQQKYFISYRSSGLGNIEADVESIHNEHRRNNFHLTTNIEDIKFSISGIDNQVKMIYQDYKKKGLSTFVKSCNNLKSESSLTNSENFNRKTMDETINKNNEKLNIRTKQLQPGLLSNLTIVKSKDKRDIQRNKMDDNKRKRNSKKKSLRQSLNMKFEENEQLDGANDYEDEDGCFQNSDIMQSDEISKQNSKEMNKKSRIDNLNEIRIQNKGKKDSKYNRDLNQELIQKKQSKNSEASKMNSSGMKRNQKYKITSVHRYKSQINCLPHNFDYQPNRKQYNEVETEGSKREKRKNAQITNLFRQNNHEKNRPPHTLQSRTNNQDYLHRVQGLIKQVEHKIEDLAQKLNDVRGRCENFVTMEKYAEDIYSQFNQIKGIKMFAIENFANKSETKKALLFMNDKIKNFISLNLLDTSKKNCSLQNCSENTQTGTIISKCLGCNREANLIEENKKCYTISPDEQKRKLIQNTEPENKGPSMTICQIKKRTTSVLKSSQRMNRKKFSKYEAV